MYMLQYVLKVVSVYYIFFLLHICTSQ